MTGLGRCDDLLQSRVTYSIPALQIRHDPMTERRPVVRQYGR